MLTVKKNDDSFMNKGPKIALQVRIDEEIHRWLKVIAAKELRSLNAQLEYFLRDGIIMYLDNEQDDPNPEELQSPAPRADK